MRVLRLDVFGTVFAIGLAVAPTARAPAQTPRSPVDRATIQIIRLTPPDPAPLLIPGLSSTIEVGVDYAGHGVPVFTLLSGPATMTIDPDRCVLVWTPPDAASDNEVEITVRGADATHSTELIFSLQVARLEPLSTMISGSTLEISEPGTLHGVRFTFPEDATVPPEQIHVDLIEDIQLSTLPSGTTPLSDPFRLSTVSAGGDSSSITVSLPSDIVPAGSAGQNLRLLVFTSDAENIDQPLWVPVWNDLDVAGDGRVSLTVHALGEPCVIGVDSAAATGNARGSGFGPTPPRSLRTNGHAITVSCVPKMLTNGTPDTHQQVCTVSGDIEMRITVKDLHKAGWRGTLTPADVVGWLVDAKAVMTDLGVKTSPVIALAVEELAPGVYGYVARSENYRTLHLTSRNKPVDLLKVTAVHEFFHHGQSRTRVAGLDNLVAHGSKARNWITEGTAMWFMDEVYDGLDSYAYSERPPLRPILYERLDAYPTTERGAKRSYARFAFWKMMASRCAGFDITDVLNTDLTTDSSGIQTFALHLQSPDWECDFGDGFGQGRRSTLGAALLYYHFATQKRNDLRLLDPSETAFYQFEGLGSGFRITPSDACVPAGPCPSTARIDRWMWPTQTFPIIIEAQTVPDTQDALLEIEIGNPPVWLWVADDRPGAALTSGRFFTQTGRYQYAYAIGGGGRRLHVAAVNPSPTSSGHFVIRAMVQEKTPVTPVLMQSTAPDPLYQSRLRGLVEWSITTDLKVIAPRQCQVGDQYVYPGDKANNHRLGIGCIGLQPPYGIVFDGRFATVPDRPQGTADMGGGKTKHWKYSNHQLQIGYPTGSKQGDPHFTYTFQRTIDNKWLEMSLCSLYDLAYWETDAEGKVTHQADLDQKQRGCLAIYINTSD